MHKKVVQKNFNFLDVEVLELSQLLDFLIGKKMKLEELLKCSHSLTETKRNSSLK